MFSKPKSPPAAASPSPLLSVGKLGHEGDVVGGPVLVGQPAVLGLLHRAVLGQVQQRDWDQRLVRVEDVVQGALEVLAHIGPLRSTGNRLDTLLYVE